ncbi:hypothetical protein F5Y11DRAFT_346548 [Daldinia sp. FL1419]|nr:hypothetical protein F5Y11DRAFT_346548 [Daldinia sp. FL1419]
MPHRDTSSRPRTSSTGNERRPESSSRSRPRADTGRSFYAPNTSGPVSRVVGGDSYQSPPPSYRSTVGGGELSPAPPSYRPRLGHIREESPRTHRTSTHRGDTYPEHVEASHRTRRYTDEGTQTTGVSSNPSTPATRESRHHAASTSAHRTLGDSGRADERHHERTTDLGTFQVRSTSMAGLAPILLAIIEDFESSKSDSSTQTRRRADRYDEREDEGKGADGADKKYRKDDDRDPRGHRRDHDHESRGDRRRAA